MPRRAYDLTDWDIAALNITVQDGEASVREAARILGLPRDECFAYARTAGLRPPTRRPVIETDKQDRPQRRCRKCKRWRLLTKFAIDPSKTLGRGFICKSCSHIGPLVANAFNPNE